MQENIAALWADLDNGFCTMNTSDTLVQEKTSVSAVQTIKDLLLDTKNHSAVSFVLFDMFLRVSAKLIGCITNTLPDKVKSGLIEEIINTKTPDCAQQVAEEFQYFFNTGCNEITKKDDNDKHTPKSAITHTPIASDTDICRIVAVFRDVFETVLEVSGRAQTSVDDEADADKDGSVFTARIAITNALIALSELLTWSLENPSLYSSLGDEGQKVVGLVRMNGDQAYALTIPFHLMVLYLWSHMQLQQKQKNLHSTELHELPIKRSFQLAAEFLGSYYEFLSDYRVGPRDLLKFPLINFGDDLVNAYHDLTDKLHDTNDNANRDLPGKDTTTATETNRFDDTAEDAQTLNASTLYSHILHAMISQDESHNSNYTVHNLWQKISSQIEDEFARKYNEYTRDYTHFEKLATQRLISTYYLFFPEKRDGQHSSIIRELVRTAVKYRDLSFVHRIPETEFYETLFTLFFAGEINAYELEDGLEFFPILGIKLAKKYHNDVRKLLLGEDIERLSDGSTAQLDVREETMKRKRGDARIVLHHIAFLTELLNDNRRTERLPQNVLTDMEADLGTLISRMNDTVVLPGEYVRFKLASTRELNGAASTATQMLQKHMECLKTQKDCPGAINYSHPDFIPRLYAEKLMYDISLQLFEDVRIIDCDNISDNCVFPIFNKTLELPQDELERKLGELLGFIQFMQEKMQNSDSLHMIRTLIKGWKRNTR